MCTPYSGAWFLEVQCPFPSDPSSQILNLLCVCWANKVVVQCWVVATSLDHHSSTATPLLNLVLLVGSDASVSLLMLRDQWWQPSSRLHRHDKVTTSPCYCFGTTGTSPVRMRELLPKRIFSLICSSTVWALLKKNLGWRDEAMYIHSQNTFYFLEITLLSTQECLRTGDDQVERKKYWEKGSGAGAAFVFGKGGQSGEVSKAILSPASSLQFLGLCMSAFSVLGGEGGGCRGLAGEWHISSTQPWDRDTERDRAEAVYLPPVTLMRDLYIYIITHTHTNSLTSARGFVSSLSLRPCKSCKTL